MSQAATLEPDVILGTTFEVDGFYEVVNGQKVEKPPMGDIQVLIAAVFDQLLGSFVRSHRLGRVVPEMLFRLNPEGIPQRRPHVAFVSYARWPRDRKVVSRNGWEIIPDLAIEVVSPGNTAEEVVRKVSEYFAAGVLRVWVVYSNVRLVYDYESSRKVYILGEGDDLDGGDLLPGFRLPLVELFEDAPEA